MDLSHGGSIFVLHVVSCALLTGLIWVIQLLHYPAFGLIQSEHFKTFHTFHSRKISYLVVPWMLLEFLTGVWLLKLSANQGFFRLNLFLIVLVWMSTFFLSVPLHSKLAEGANPELVRRLVKTNWPRTFLWSGRLVLLLLFSMTQN